MWRRQRIIGAVFLGSILGVWSLMGWQAAVQADSANAPSLVISQFKITSSNGQFITLYNPTSTTLDMSKYQLEYFNSYDLGKATSSKLIALTGSLPPHGYFMVNDGALLLCYQLTVDSVSLGLSATAGLVEVLAFNQASPGSSVTPILQDYIGWSKTAASGAQIVPTNTSAFLQRQPVDAQNNPSVSVAGSGSWQSVQPDTSNTCKLVSGSSTSTPVPTGLNQLLPGSEPPASIVTLASDDSDISTSTPASLPVADIGLMAPEITEILPNPSGTGNDSSDEFIELYNPNSSAFDLSGFSLQAGTTALHNFSFPAGTNLPAASFTAFYSADTGLSLSNSGGQVKLLDPFGNSISVTDIYGTAADGQAWALASGKWYWTTSLTPGSANVINQPVTAKKSSSKTSKSRTAKTLSVKASAAKSSKTSASSNAADSGAASTTPIHLWTLALVGSLALLYGIYEYRADLANRIHQLRLYLKTRRPGRAPDARG
jgi:hypothetical protein